MVNSSNYVVADEQKNFFLSSDGWVFKRTASDVYDFFIYLDVASFGLGFEHVPIDTSGYVMQYSSLSSGVKLRYAYVEKTLLSVGSVRVRLQLQHKIPFGNWEVGGVSYLYDALPVTLKVKFE